jgi:hypothetical protein
MEARCEILCQLLGFVQLANRLVGLPSEREPEGSAIKQSVRRAGPMMRQFGRQCAHESPHRPKNYADRHATAKNSHAKNLAKCRGGRTLVQLPQRGNGRHL